jgi:DNA polymerase-3 subunit delta
VEQIAIAADVVPFMSEYNFVKVTDYNINELRKEDFEKLKHILKNLPSTTILLFTFPTLEISGKNFSSVMTYAKNNGIAVEFKKYDKNALAKTLVEGAYKRGCSLAEVNAGKIVDYCGTDLIALQNELEKLCNYANGKEITIEMIDSLVHINLETKVYYLADNIISNNISKAYEQLAILFDQKAEPVMIVSSIAGAYIDLYRSRVANENGLSMEKVAEDFGYGKRSFVLKNKLKAGWKIPTDKIRDSINIIAETDYKMKSTSADDKVLLETLIAKLSLIARGELKNA